MAELGTGSISRTQAPPVQGAARRAARAAVQRPEVRGPFLFVGDEKLVVRAVTYGTFAADANGDLYPSRDTVRRDFDLMRAANVNAIRTYTAPPDWLMEEARAAGLRVLAGIWWDARDCRFDDRKHLRAARKAVRDAVARLEAFPDVVLAYSIGNEIPPLTARFHGRNTVYRFMERVYETAKREAPDALVTYGTYPSTEFLTLDFLDFQTLNVYLLEKQALSAYLDRMMVVTNGKPLLLGEVGDDSIRRGEAWQAELLDWTIPLALDKGAAGVCVFSWTDDWVVAGNSVDDWAFGIVDRARRPKPAYGVVARRFGEPPTSLLARVWPRVSVVVCNYNGAATLDETLCSLRVLDYPDYEVILVDDGSRDASLEIAKRHADRVRLLTHEGHVNLGLSVSRNVGAQAATGEIVAYIDSDAFADRDWLRHLVVTMESGGYAGAGGPNLTPASDGLVAQFIALCPGNPTHVLKDNVRADHIAGVNMAFRRSLLLGIGGFDPVHTRAGDDVDVCWRFEDAGHTLAFSPAAIVWHHRRASVRTYFRQQSGYGIAENQLETKHPDRFNLAGAIRWSGRVYGAARRTPGFLRPFVYHGFLGEALFQTLYTKEAGYLHDLPSTFQWYVVWTLLFAATPFSYLFPAFGAAMFLASVAHAVAAGAGAEPPFHLTPSQRRAKTLLVSFVHFLHPVVRTWGRLAARVKSVDWRGILRPEPWMAPQRVFAEGLRLGGGPKEQRRYWGVGGAAREALLRGVQRELRASGPGATFGRDWDNYDLEIVGGPATAARLYSAPEAYDQAICFGFSVRTSPWAFAVVALLAAACAAGTIFGSRGFAAFAVLPVGYALALLATRARLRSSVWAAVDAAVTERGGKRFGEDA